MMQKRRMKLGEILVERNLILPEHLEAALERQKTSGRRLGQVLVDMGLVSHDDVMNAVSDQTGIPHIRLRKGLVDPGVVRILPKEKAQSYGVIPMFKVRNSLTLGMTDSADLFAIDNVETLTKCKVQPVQCRKEDVEAAIGEYYSETLQMEEFVESFQASDVQVADAHVEDLRMVAEVAQGARVINLVNLILLRAINEGASDIHIEPDAASTRVRYRIDGALQETMNPRSDLHSAIVSRIKVMSKMDIAERRLPQDGRMHVVAEGKDVDMRVSSMPTVLGEKIVIRLLDKGKMTLDINRVGFHSDVLNTMKGLLKRPHGILLVTGPTGSGKTTTLYSGLSYISSVERNIITIEDPVEYQLPLVNQIQTHNDQGLNFAKILRSALRQDPDVIMVGEIRDKETAEVAIQAALTGHLVLSTLHTNDSAGAVARLIEMGIQPFLLTSSLIGVLAQRLVRNVCESCKTSYFPPRELLDRIGWHGKNTSFVKGRGCEKCFDSGLRGRSAVFELLVMDDALRGTVLRDPSAHAIQAAGARSGMRTLRDEAFRLVEDGKTSLEEVMRVVFIEDSAAEPLAKTGT